MDGVQSPVVWWKSGSAHFKHFSTVVIMCISVYLPSNVLQHDLFYFIFFLKVLIVSVGKSARGYPSV